MATNQNSSTQQTRQITQDMTVAEAAEIIFSHKVMRALRPASLESTRGQINALVKFFAEMPLYEIAANSLHSYQCDRSKVACAHTVNHELALLKKMLKKAVVVVDGVKGTLWDAIDDSYHPLRPKDWAPPKTFTLQEQQRIFAQAANDPHLELANIVFTITRNTTASGSELRGLRMRHLELEASPPRIHVPPDSTKNDVRPRVIPLNEQALKAFRMAVDRAARLGSHRPDNYLFPFRINRAHWDPYKPASKSWLRKQTVRLRASSEVAHLKPHAFRHLAVTELLESGAPEQTVIALAGWVGRKMIETYSHARIEAKADAVNLIGAGAPKAAPPPTPAPEPIAQPAVTLDLIRAEISRQVAALLQQIVPAPEPVQSPAKGPRLLRFPGGA